MKRTHDEIRPIHGKSGRQHHAQTSMRVLVAGCVAALVILAGLGLTGYLRIHDLTARSRSSSALLGAAARLRTHLQKSALLAEQLSHEVTPAQRVRLKAGLATAVDGLDRDHERLLAGPDLCPAAAQVLGEAPYEASKGLVAYLARVRSLLVLPEGSLLPEHDHMREVVLTATSADSPLRQGLDEIVRILEVESDARLDRLLVTENWALGISVLALLMTGLLVLAPMIRSVQRHVSSLADLNETLEDRVAERSRRYRRSEHRIRAVLNAVVEAIITIDEKGCIEALNPAAEDMFGYSAEDLIGQNVRLLMPSPHAEGHDGYLRRYLETGQKRIIGQRRLLEGRRRDGATFPMELAVSEVRAGGRTGFVGIVRDVTERVQAEAALRYAKDAAESANRTKSEFLANMSHEIRTPMNGVIGMTELALDTELSQEQREYLLAVRNSATDLLHIINDILDFSKIEAGRMELEATSFSLRDIIGQTLKTLASRAHLKGLELAWDVAPDVPDALLGDPVRLRQILVNLVGNAIKFTHEGEVVVRVRLDTAKEDQVRLLFGVRDTGIGIPAERQGEIFDAFAQADASTTRRYGGTGLGLAISSQLVQLMGGSIELTSVEGEGSTFSFDAILGRGTPVPDNPATITPAALRALDVLVVDDNDTNRRVLGRMLDSWGMRPTIVEHGAAALEALERAANNKRPFSLVLLDYHMPDMDGLMVAARIRERHDPDQVRLLLLTSGARPDREARVGDLGIHAQLVKPVTQSELLDAVLRAVEPRSAEPLQGGVEPEGEVTVPSAPSIRPLHVLLAEDNPINQRLARRLLEKQGHRVQVVDTGRAAVDALEGDASFDLALMDVQMPEMDGYEATAAIRRRERGTTRHLPIVAMTAHAMQGDRERCLAAGMDVYLAKPIDPLRLAAVLQEALASQPPEPHAAFDRATALERAGGDAAFLAELAALFLETRDDLLGAVTAAVDAGDGAVLERAAHALKGSVANFGAEAAVEAAEALEQRGRDGRLEGARALLDRLQTEIESLGKALAHEAGRPPV